MTSEEFILEVQVKLNRLDSSSYQDVRPEEIIFFANDALKLLTLGFDSGVYSQIVDKPTILRYLAGSTSSQAELTLTDNKRGVTDNIIKLKDVEVFVEIGSGETAESGWMPTRELDNEYNSKKEYNNFTKSYPDRPSYRLINSEITFNVDGFTCTKVRYDYLFVVEITEVSGVNFPFNQELEDKTVTLILENLEARRLQTQPTVSKA